MLIIKIIVSLLIPSLLFYGIVETQRRRWISFAFFAVFWALAVLGTYSAIWYFSA